ncbi:MAG: zinc-dependent peptidase [Flavobacteriales bacterium]|mgnify:CR=1 FL=1|nr:zinc-dependent peptidase [Flavobacteriales bacterium]MBK7556367.1 zinc-dependent peptidase [Flavobacteriales bacterium]MBK9193640.1 zinc-dependent peptidase [Flavobacteriales bacterium]
MENWIVGIIGIIGLLALALGFLFIVGREVFDMVGIIGHSIAPMGRRDRVLLEQHSAFYRRLSSDRQREFRRRVKEFVYEKHWVGKDIKLTREMKVRISATAVQLTFGLEPLLLLHFGSIIIYPDVYRDRHSGDLYKGATYVRRGTIALSWKHFIEGGADLTDAVHLGLHEMAHALWLENRIPNEEDDFLDPAALADWNRLAMTEIQMVRAGESRLFRRYAGTNEAEFFACAVEYFFECTAAFKEKMPAEYDAMCGLLKQDPTKNPG